MTSIGSLQPQRPAPVRAIAARRAVAAANRQRIAAAIAALARDGLPVTVRGVARVAGVHPDTVRRSGDLYVEIQQHRAAPAPRTLAPSTSPDRALKARLLNAQAEVAELRRELASTSRALHQALGQSGTMIDPAEVTRLQHTNAEQALQIIELQDQVKALTDEQRQLVDELSATREVNREYVRDLNAVRAELQRSRLG